MRRTAYPGLAAALFLLMLSETVVQTVDGSWVGDFWEHSAVVRELARHLVHPLHPILALDVKHEFFSPYALALAAVSRVTGASAVSVLAGAGLVNLLLLLAALPRFVRLFTRAALAPFLVLLFTLFLWGRHPLVYSGFFHFDVIGFVLPYPSTFATALALWAAGVWGEGLPRPGPRRVAFVAAAAAVILLTHPVAAFFLGALLVALSLEQLRSAALRLGVVGAAALAAAIVWPYYPFFRLLRDEGVFDESNHPLYQSIPAQVFPALLGLPFLVLRLRRRRLDPLAVVFAALVLVYAVGGATSHWSLGRVLPYAVLLLDVALAAPLAERLAARPLAALALGAALVAVAWPLMGLEGPVARAVPRALEPASTDRFRPESVGTAYGALFAGVPPDSVTIASEPAGWPVPTYGGRIVAALHPQAFVDDLAARARDVRTFFLPSTTTAERRRIICRYGVTDVLVDRREHGVAPSALAPVARIVRSASTYVLLDARRCAHG